MWNWMQSACRCLQREVRPAVAMETPHLGLRSSGLGKQKSRIHSTPFSICNLHIRQDSWFLFFFFFFKGICSTRINYTNCISIWNTENVYKVKSDGCNIAGVFYRRILDEVNWNHCKIRKKPIHSTSTGQTLLYKLISSDAATPFGTPGLNKSWSDSKSPSESAANITYNLSLYSVD